jgi:hypothetical protein
MADWGIVVTLWMMTCFGIFRSNVSTYFLIQKRRLRKYHQIQRLGDVFHFLQPLFSWICRLLPKYSVCCHLGNTCALQILLQLTYL